MKWFTTYAQMASASTMEFSFKCQTAVWVEWFKEFQGEAENEVAGFGMKGWSLVSDKNVLRPQLFFFPSFPIFNRRNSLALNYV